MFIVFVYFSVVGELGDGVSIMLLFFILFMFSLALEESDELNLLNSLAVNS